MTRTKALAAKARAVRSTGVPNVADAGFRADVPALVDALEEIMQAVGDLGEDVQEPTWNPETIRALKAEYEGQGGA